jgi:NADH:ubiquinone oxidoreductase subunit 6 (subunit J)
VAWLAEYVYGTITTLVAIAGITFEKNPEALTTAGVVVVGAVAIWLAHGLSRVVTLHSWRELQLTRSDVGNELRGSWPIVSAALPATIVFTLAGVHLWPMRSALVLAETVGVLALAVVGMGTAGSRGRSLGRRVLYTVGLISVGALIVLLELAVHLL